MNPASQANVSLLPCRSPLVFLAVPPIGGLVLVPVHCVAEQVGAGTGFGQVPLLLGASHVTSAVPPNAKPALQANVAMLPCRSPLVLLTLPLVGGMAPLPVHCVAEQVGALAGVGQAALLLGASHFTSAVPLNSKPALQANVAVLPCRSPLVFVTAPWVGGLAPLPVHFVAATKTTVTTVYYERD